MIKYSSIGANDEGTVYQWHVVTSAGTVITGQAYKSTSGSWLADVRVDDGEPVVNTFGNAPVGGGRTRTEAVRRALGKHTNPAAAWLDLMNH